MFKLYMYALKYKNLEIQLNFQLEIENYCMHWTIYVFFQSRTMEIPSYKRIEILHILANYVCLLLLIENIYFLSNSTTSTKIFL